MKKNIFFSISQIILGTILTFVTFGFIAQKAGLELVGAWGIILSVGSITRLSELGLATAAIKFVAQENKPGNKEKLIATINTIFFTVACLVIFVSMILLLIVKYLQRFTYENNIFDLVSDNVVLLLLGFSIGSLASVLCSVLDGLERFDIRAYCVLAGQAFMTGVVLFGVEEFGLQALVFGLLVQALSTLSLALFCLFFQLRPFTVPLILFDREIFFTTTPYGLKLFGSSILMLLFEPVTKLFLMHYGNLSIVGAFEIANQLLQKIRSLLSGALQVLTPKFAKSARENIMCPDLLIKTFSVYLPIVVHGVVVVIVCSTAIAHIISPAEVDLLSNTIVMLAIAWLINTLSMPVYFYNIGIGQAWTNLKCFALMSLVNIVLASTLGEHFGFQGVMLGYGVALSTGGVYLLYNMDFNMPYSSMRKVLHIKFKDYVVPPFILCFTYYFARQYNDSLLEHLLYCTFVIFIFLVSLFSNQNFKRVLHVDRGILGK